MLTRRRLLSWPTTLLLTVLHKLWSVVSSTLIRALCSRRRPTLKAFLRSLVFGERPRGLESFFSLFFVWCAQTKFNLYQLKKSKKSKARFYTATSTYFSYRKHPLFSFFIPKNPSRNNTGKVSMKCKRRKFKNLDLAINYARLEMNHTCLVTRISF